MDAAWQKTFRERMSSFETRRKPSQGDLSVSIKVRVTSGCFHREHSPQAYAAIDRHLNAMSRSEREFSFEEHESGPELLAYLAVTTAGLTLAKSVIDLVIAIIKARSEGVKKGDNPAEPVELIVRCMDNGSEYREETVLRVQHGAPLDAKAIEQHLDKALRKLAQPKKKGKAKTQAK